MLSEDHRREQQRLRDAKAKYDERIQQLKDEGGRYRVLENDYIDSDQRSKDLVWKKKRVFALRQASKRQETRFAEIR